LTRILLACAAFAASTIPGAAFAQSQPAQAAPQSETRANFAAKIDSAFNNVDTNHDGNVTKAEIQALQTKELQDMQTRQQQQMDAEFKKLDTNHDNSLSVAEFKAAARPLPAPAPDEPLKRLDTNKDGKISKDEYRAPKLADFDKADANHDGTVTVAELQAIAKRQ
jgi:Ca2+-binding EF-hand superfamily protein